MIIVGFLMLIGIIGVVIVLLAEAHEWAEAIWTSAGRRSFVAMEAEDEQLPMVSVHVPAYNEPPEMMIETLNALAPSIIHISRSLSSTTTPRIRRSGSRWKPTAPSSVRAFVFFMRIRWPASRPEPSIMPWPKPQPEAEVVAVIDSDYMVSTNWLRDLVPQFLRPEVAIVQAPQDYRDDGDNLFKAMCYAEYRGFFYIGMVTRNERNAIIQHGTMTMVRKSVLEEVGGWAEWCITEDAELGLRSLRRGMKHSISPKPTAAESCRTPLSTLKNSVIAGPTARFRSSAITPRPCSGEIKVA